MGLFTGKQLDTFDALLIDQLEDLYDAEQRITQALPKMAEAAHDPALKAGFEHHLRQTHNHLTRLEQVFRMLGHSASGRTCFAMKGLIDEGEEIVAAKGNDSVIDAALIGAAQKVEHYEIAGYGTARSFAQRLGRNDAAALLQQTLDEEGETNKKLTQLAESHINQVATA